MARIEFEYRDIPGVTVAISRAVPESIRGGVDWRVSLYSGLGSDFVFAGHGNDSDLRIAYDRAYADLTANNRRELERYLWLAILKLERMHDEQVHNRSDSTSDKQPGNPELGSLALEGRGGSSAPDSNRAGRWRPFG